MQKFIQYWQGLAQKEGLKGIYFVGATRRDEDLPGFDATAHIDPFESPKQSIMDRILSRLKNKLLKYPRRIIQYNDVINFLKHKKLKKNEFPVITPNWDNTARSGSRGSVIVNSNPEKFDVMLKNTLHKIEDRDPDKKIIFVEAWNEWAEGNYLEPDIKYGRGFLEMIKKNIFGSESND